MALLDAEMQDAYRIWVAYRTAVPAQGAAGSYGIVILWNSYLRLTGQICPCLFRSTVPYLVGRQRACVLLTSDWALSRIRVLYSTRIWDFICTVHHCRLNLNRGNGIPVSQRGVVLSR